MEFLVDPLGMSILAADDPKRPDCPWFYCGEFCAFGYQPPRPGEF